MYSGGDQFPWKDVRACQGIKYLLLACANSQPTSWIIVFWYPFVYIPQKDGSPSYVNFQYWWFDARFKSLDKTWPGPRWDRRPDLGTNHSWHPEPQCFKKSNIVTKGLTTIIHPICLQMLIGFEGASVQIFWWPAHSPPADPCESGCKSGTKLCERSQVVITAHDSTCSRWSCHFDPKIKFCEKITKITGPKYPKTPNR